MNYLNIFGGELNYGVCLMSHFGDELIRADELCYPFDD